MKKIKVFFLTLIITFSFVKILKADEDLNNKIYKNLRCLVCQGQSIADSNSDFAQTIKSVVKDQTKNGMKEDEIYSFLSEKYGDWILYKPPLKNKSYILWALPYIFFIIGALIIFFILKKTIKIRKY